VLVLTMLVLVPVAGAVPPPPLLTPSWVLEGTETNGYFGTAVVGGDFDGDGLVDLAVGSPGVDLNDGQIDLWRGDAAGLPLVSDQTLASLTPASLGIALAACDVNGDGLADLVAGAPDAEDAFVYAGTTTGVDAAAWSLADPAPGAGSNDFGIDVACGDVDQDGFADVFVGAQVANQGAGRALLFPGSAAGPVDPPTWQVDGAAGDLLGGSVAVLGDVNGDGGIDLAVGTGTANDGEASVYHGVVGGVPPAVVPDWVFGGDPPAPGDPASNEIVAAAGDVDADGFDDLLIGAPYADPNGVFDAGRAWLFRGGVTGLDSVDAWSTDGASEFDQLGTGLAGLPDLDGDGDAEIAVTAPQWTDTFIDEGAAFVFEGAAGGAETSPSLTVFGGMTSAFLSSVAPLGDVNGDTTFEVALGAPIGANGAVFVLSTPAPPDDTGDTGDTGDTDLPVDTDDTDDTDLPVDTDDTDDTDVEDTDDGDTDDDDGGCNCAVGGAASLAWLAPALVAITARRRSSTP
jgi:MYXO-CTERM domain-containing protein